MNGILGQQVAEKTALFRSGNRSTPSKQPTTSPTSTQHQQAAQSSTPAAVHRVHSAPNKQPEPVCIQGCCGFGKLIILWTSGDSPATMVNDSDSDNGSSLNRTAQTPGAGFADTAMVVPSHDVAPLDDAEQASEGGSERLGRIQFTLSYDFDQSTLMLKIIRAVELAAKDITGRSDPYVKVMLLPDKKNKLLTNIKRRNLNPRWNEVFSFEGTEFDIAGPATVNAHLPNLNRVRGTWS